MDGRVGVGAAEKSAARGTGVCEVAGVGPATGTARGRPADRPTKTKAETAADRQERPRKAGDGRWSLKVNWGPLPPAPALSSFARSQGLA